MEAIPVGGVFALEGEAGSGKTLILGEVYRACGDKDHPDWEEYDRAMRAQDAVIVLVRPQRVYGLVR